MFEPIKVLLVDDSALVRQMLVRALALDPRIQVIGIAKTGVEAVEKTLELKPDVITLDIEMPELSGLEALPLIVAQSEARVIMLSTLDDPDTTYQALSSGAIDFVGKPTGGFASSISELSDVLVKKIKTAYRVPSSKIREASRRSLGRAPEVRPDKARRAVDLDKLVLIASSTGGPPALETVFGGLKATVPAAYMVVQHLPAGFSASLARRLSRRTDIDVKEAGAGDVLMPASAYVAPYGRHMEVYRDHAGELRIALREGPSLHGVVPSADPLFMSAASTSEDVVGVVLTGMGTDGVEGLAAVQRAGGRTIAQDEPSSVVWGMPGAAVKRGVADRVAPLAQVAVEIRRAVGGSRSRG